jgi:peptidoglycan/LPS O-acetylase OafA/YrhL
MASPGYREYHHSLSTAFLSLQNLFLYGIQKFLETGRSAVILFFVLSGFVLTHSLLEQPMYYAGYAAKRLFRIYPAFLFMILYSFLFHRFIVIQNTPSLPTVAFLLSHTDISFTVLLKHLLMFGNEPNNVLDPAMWSIVHEIRISLILPLLILAVARFRGWSILACFVLSCLCTLSTLHATGNVADGITDATVLRSFISTGYFIVFFACGALLAIERRSIVPAMTVLAGWRRVTLYIIFLGCFVKSDVSSHLFAEALIDYIRGMAAGGLITLIISMPARKSFLEHPLLQRLGRISYSLYLVHFVILFLVNAANEDLGEPFSVLGTGIVSVMLSLLAADCITQTIEQPINMLGKRFLLRVFVPALQDARAGTSAQATA